MDSMSRHWPTQNEKLWPICFNIWKTYVLVQGGMVQVLNVGLSGEKPTSFLVHHCKH